MAEMAAYSETIPTTLEDWKRLAHSLGEAYEIRCAELEKLREAIAAIDLRPGLSDLGMALTILNDHGAEGLELAVQTARAAFRDLGEEQERICELWPGGKADHA